MIDSWMVRQIQPTLNQFALDWVPKWLRANAVTVIGFLVFWTSAAISFFILRWFLDLPWPIRNKMPWLHHF